MNDDDKIPIGYFEGKVVFTNYVKNFGVISYLHEGLRKEILFFLSHTRPHEFAQHDPFEKEHRYWVGDVVWFKPKPTENNGGKLIAQKVFFKHNDDLRELIEKAKTNNHFFGQYIIAEEQYFVKELLTEIIFPLVFMEYEAPPAGDELSLRAYFRIINIHDAKKRAAELIEKRFITASEDPHYHLHHGTVFDAIVNEVKPNHVKITIPFFDNNDARIDAFNCNKDMKRKYSLLKPEQRIKVKLHLISGPHLIVKIAEDRFI